MKLKPIITEVIILFVIYIVTWLLSQLLSIPVDGRNMLDINMHDTYFVIERSAIVMLIFTTPLFLMLTTLVYLIKEGFYRYKRKLQNLILLVANFLFLTVMYPLSLLINMIKKAGGILYPPLSALPNTVSPTHYDNNAAYTSVPALIIIFMLILVITAILTGKNWNFNKNEQTPA